MTNDGGRANEPTSYDLRPPQTPAAPAPPPPAPVPSQGESQDRQPPHTPYEPTQFDGPVTPVQATPGGPGRPASAQPDPRTSPPAPAASDPNVGRVIGGRYRLVSRLGHGGMGTVWKAHDQVVDRDVAVKEPRVPDTLPEGERQKVYQRMQREARAAARIDHPSVVSVYDVAVEDGRPWLVMELVRGDSLADRLAEGTLDPREAARIGVAVVGALTAAHEAGVLHRDVKPDNVLLGRNDRVVLTDFGIAQVEGEQGLTETGAFVGSPEFIAPERVLGQRPGLESDLWSLGVVLYAAVEGMSPFRRSHAPATLQAILSAEPQTPARGSGALGTLIMQLLRKDAAARPTAAETRQALEEVARPPQPVPTMLTTRLYGQAGDAGGGGPQSGDEPQGAGSCFVPPILHKNRKAQLGLGGVVLVVAAALVLVLMKPFASEGSGLPSGWTVRDEREVVDASLAVPEDYKRVLDDSDEDNQSVTFKDPSGVFTVYLLRAVKDGEEDVTGLKDAVEKTIAKRESDTQYDYADAHSRQVESSQQGQPAEDVNTTYRPYSSNRDDYIPYLDRTHIYVNSDKTQWQLTVTMPAKGEARKTGDKLYEDVVKHLEIQREDLKTAAK
ncbi:serine/threonine-protein kinase [Streptomyces sp. ME19-01-6]|uniref:serine/threonine-protein kinase n=1 Tax=Streptomyces sp. ME19-01-6 TaxID=3028686 RepID=UPI0029A53A98|nr:serine/threonine-protein kinase [Streptomyces sp. ME19-01-6]MDX3227424.1 serine/threonine-protein kinase [Streptomyces sp. ME19-01-6]